MKLTYQLPLIYFLFAISHMIYSQDGGIDKVTFDSQLKTVNTNLNKLKVAIQNDKPKNEILKLFDESEKSITYLRSLNTQNVQDVVDEKDKEIAKLKGEITTLKSQITQLKDEITAKQATIAGLQNDATKDILELVDKSIKEKSEVDQQLSKLEGEKTTLQENFDKTKNNLSRVEGQYEELQAQYNLERKIFQQKRSLFRVGLSAGFNFFWNREQTHFVTRDSTIAKAGSPNGLSGIISGVAMFRISDPEKPTIHDLVLNIPLGDFTANSDNGIGVFNSRVALGLGYAISPGIANRQVAATVILNISPYATIDDQVLEGNPKFNLPVYSELNPEDYPKQNKASVSLSFGLIYTPIAKKLD